VSGFGGFDTYEEWQRDQRRRLHERQLREMAEREKAEADKQLESLWQKLTWSGHDRSIELLREFGESRYSDGYSEGLTDTPESNDGYPI